MGDFLHTIGGKIAAVVLGILLLFSGGAHTATNTQSSVQAAAAVVATTQDPFHLPADATSAASSTGASSGGAATTTIVNNYITQPVIERTVQTTLPPTGGFVTQADLANQLNALSNTFGKTIYGTTYPAPATNYGSGGVFNTISLMSKIDNLSGTNLSSITVNGVSGLTDADIPNGITASNYLALSGGTLSGDLVLTGSLTVSGAQTLSGAITIPYLTATSTTASSFVQASSTRFSIFDTAYFGGTSTTTINSIGSITLPSAALLIAPYASSTAITVSGTASTSALVASNSFTFSNVTGFLKAVAGAVSTALVNLASDVTGILPVANGGTGWANIAASAIPYGNGSSAIATSSALTFDGTKLVATYASSTSLTISGTEFNTNVQGADTAFLSRHDPTIVGTVGTAAGNVANTKYGLSFQPVRFTNGPVGETAYIDNTWHWGINGGNNRIDSTKGSLGFSFEDRFYDGTRFGFEAHLQGVADDGVTTFRPWSYFVARDASLIGADITADYLNLKSRAGTQMVKFDFQSGAKNINVNESTKFVFGNNNAVIATQKNAAGSAFLNLPYIDAGDVLVTSQPVYVVGSRAGAAATFPGTFAVFQPTTANSGDTMLNLVGLSVSGSHNGVVARTSATGLFKQEFNNQGAGSSEIFVGVEGAGDPYIQFNDLAGRFLVGIDNSDSHKLKISTGSALGTGDVLAIDSSGNVGIATSSPWRKFSVTGTVGFDGLTGATGAGSLCLDSNKQVVYNSGSDACLSSTRATKHDIQYLNLDALAIVSALQPVSFVYNNDASSTIRYGFIAEDTATIDNHLATHDASGAISGIDDRSIIAVLVDAVQNLIQKFADLAERLVTKEIVAVNINADTVTAKKIKGDELCAGNTCVTETQLQALLNQAGQQPAPQTQSNTQESTSTIETETASTTPATSDSEEQASESQPDAAASSTEGASESPPQETSDTPATDANQPQQ